jgi:RNA ligase (TIGR02306 family)
MTERKLSTIQQIDDLSPIEDADKIEIAHILGWQVVVKKDQFKVGDFVVYHEIDSFLPIHLRYEFLRKSCYKNVEGLGEGFRIRTIKLRKQISQGLILPLDDYNIFQESETVFKYTNVCGNTYYLSPQEDLSELFGIIKYDPPVPACLRGQAKGNFPSFIPRTDETRIQNLWKRNKKDIVNHSFERTLKLDGSSVTFFNYEGQVGVCSRNLELKLEDNTSAYVKFANETDILQSIPEGYAVQAELMGPGIQGNREKLKTTEIYIFNIFNIVEQRYLTPEERCKFYWDFLTGERIKHCPFLGNILISEDTELKDLLEYSDITPSINHDISEGIVYKRLDGKYSFKVISNRFLLNEKD